MLQLMYCLRGTTILRVEKMHSTVHCVLGVAKFLDTSQTLGNMCSTSDSFLPIVDIFLSNFQHVFLQISACFLPILNMLFPNLDTFVFQILTCSFQIMTCFFPILNTFFPILNMMLCVHYVLPYKMEAFK